MKLKMKFLSYKRLGFHALYWTIFILVYSMFWTAFRFRVFDFDTYVKQIVGTSFGLIYLIPIIYFITYYLIPKLFQSKKILLSVFLSLCIVFIAAYIDDLVTIYIYYPIFDPGRGEIFKIQLFFHSVHIFISSGLIFIQTISFVFVKYIKEYFTSFFEKQKLQQQINEAELKMLKSQLHPHFLFNTLNNIYSLSLSCSNPLVSESIDRISSILRFSVYECNGEIVNLSKEITIIKDYIELERIRYSSISIDASYPDEVNNVYIIPLLLFTFVENAFKHGTSKSIDNKWIKLNLSITDKKLFFDISNSKNPKIQSDFNNYTEGLGLKNAIRRLDLFYGSENYTLVKNDKNDKFEIELVIDLRPKNK